MLSVTTIPFILATLFPSFVTCRVIITVPSSTSISFSSRIFITLLGASKTACTTALSVPYLTSSLFALSPKIIFIESIIIDLPAPVSPVSTLTPSCKFMSSLSITATFLTESWFNILCNTPY